MGRMKARLLMEERWMRVRLEISGYGNGSCLVLDIVAGLIISGFSRCPEDEWMNDWARQPERRLGWDHLGNKTS